MTQQPLTAVVQVGNSDDKLSQAEWSLFCRAVGRAVQHEALQVHFSGFSLPNAPWQNACWVFEVDSSARALLPRKLRGLAGEFGQDSIALTLGETVLVTAQ